MTGGGKKVTVQNRDRREANWMQVMEEYDSEDQSIHTSDEEEDEEAEGSEADKYENDFVLPDHVIVYEDGQVVELCDSVGTLNPFGKPPKGQPDSTITTADGNVITVSWRQQQSAPANSNNNRREMSQGRMKEDDEDSDEEFKEPDNAADSNEEEDSDDAMSISADEQEEEEEEELPEGARVIYTGTRSRRQAAAPRGHSRERR